MIRSEGTYCAEEVLRSKFTNSILGPKGAIVHQALLVGVNEIPDGDGSSKFGSWVRELNESRVHEARGQTRQGSPVLWQKTIPMNEGDGVKVPRRISWVVFLDSNNNYFRERGGL